MPKPGQTNHTPVTGTTLAMLNRRITKKMRFYTAAGKLEYSTEKDFDEIAKEVIGDIIADMNALGPDMEEPEKSLSEFWEALKNEYPNLPEKPRFDGKNEEIKQRMKRITLYRDALLAALIENGKKDLIFQQTARQLFPDKKNLELTKNRYLHRLMQIPAKDADPEIIKKCQSHNEKVVMLSALLKKDITVDQFRQMQRDRYKKAGLDEDAAQEAASKDVTNAPQDFFDLFDTVVRQGKEYDAEIPDLTEKALSGNLDQDGLKQAFQKIFYDSSQLRFVALDFTGDLENLMQVVNVHSDQFNRDKNAEYVAQCQNEAAMLQTCQNVVCISTNPYYAILDPVQMIDAGVLGLKENSSIELVPEDNYSYNVSFVTDFVDILSQNIFQTGEFLKRYQLEDAAENPFPGGRTFHAFADNRKKRALICEREEFSLDHGYKFKMKVTDRPGAYVREGFAEKVEALNAKGGTLTYGWHGSSRQFDEMLASLERLKKVSLDNDATDALLNNMQRSLENVKAKTNLYLERKRPKRKRRGGRGKNKYEEDRWQFANDLYEFVDEKLKQIENVRWHKTTVNAVEQEERQQAAAEVNPDNLIVNENIPQNENKGNNEVEKEDGSKIEDVPKEEIKKEAEIKAEPKVEVIPKEEIKNENINVIHEAKKVKAAKIKPLSKWDAEMIFDCITEGIEAACKSSKLENWAKDESLAEKDSKYRANYFMDYKIKDDLEEARSDPKYGMAYALVDSVIKYMMNQEKSKGILEFLLEHGKHIKLASTLKTVIFNYVEPIEEQELENQELMTQYLKDETLFIKPMGDEIFKAVEPVLKNYERKVIKRNRSIAIDLAKDKVEKQYYEYLHVLDKGCQEEAEAVGRDCLAWRTVQALLERTSGKVDNPYLMRNSLLKSNEFEEEVKKIDFNKVFKLTIK